ncbi:MAG TPA: rod shape-determining protein RodA [bacterium]
MGRTDTRIIFAAVILSIIGLVMIFSTGGLNALLKQSIWLGISLAVCIAFARISPRFWIALSPYVYFVVVVLLLLIFFASSGYPRRWFHLGEISIQPSEFAKLGTIIFLAAYLARQKKFEKFTHMLIPLVIISLPAALVFVEPDLGAAQIFFPILVVMFFWAGMPGAKIFIFFSPLLSAIASFSIYLWVVYIAGFVVFLALRKKLSDLVYGLITNPLAGLMMPVIWNSLKVYQQKRIISFLAPWLDPRGMSWQVIQSKIAIGSGRILGKGFLAGTQKKFEFLPERHTDFIFSCIGEEFGLIGIIVVLALYTFMLYRILDLAQEARNRFASIFTIGVFTWFAYQTVINTGMTMGLLPITGVPLPFISYGGSSLLACFLAVGMLLSISRTRLEY